MKCPRIRKEVDDDPEMVQSSGGGAKVIGRRRSYIAFPLGVRLDKGEAGSGIVVR